MSLSSGARLGAYEIVSPLGAGGMGEVYRARDARLDRDVAVKVLPDRLASDPDARHRFQREAKAIAALSHPNILTIHDVGAEQDLAYAVTELLDGETLGGAIGREGALPWRRALDIGLAIAEGLAAAHAKGIIHRDIKPANIFVTTSGAVKILDFGLAKSFDAGSLSGSDSAETGPFTAELDATTPGTIVGTLGYMSPEQAKGQAATAASDVFSLGCVLYEMLTGIRPFVRETTVETLAAIMKDDPLPFAKSGKEVPAELRRIVFRALQKDPAARYQSAAELRDALVDYQRSLTQPADARAVLRVVRRPVVAIPTVVVIALVGAGIFWSATRESKEVWARETAISEIMELIEAEDFLGAFRKAQEAEQYIPDDAVLGQLWPQTSRERPIRTTPPGADIYYKPYADADGPWEHLGRSDLEGVRLPLGAFRLKIEKEGFEPVVMAAVVPRFARHELNLSSVTLSEQGSVPPGMILIEPQFIGVPLTGLPPFQPVALGRFYIDRTEVTNRQFKEFVDARGYERREFWKHEFSRDGRVVSWEEATRSFVDSTGRPGPAAWEVGDNPDGQDDYPVGGVSWFEAAAYAAFRGKSLPTVFHWVTAALAANEVVAPLSPSIVPLSNFGSEGPAPVASHPGIGVSGAYDMAGNVREWCFNAAGDRRYSLGGAWGDPLYMFTLAQAESPWDRFPTNGFRCAMYPEGTAPSESLTGPIELPSHDFYETAPLSEEAFAVVERQFRYDPTPLNATIESTDDGPTQWRRETVTVDAAYGNERLILHLALPSAAEPPYQAVVVFPGLYAIYPRPFTENRFDDLAYIIKSGRAVVFPIYADTFERSEGRTQQRLNNPSSAEALLAEWGKDLGRTIDYLETRPDIDADKLAYNGNSLGAMLGAMLLAVEPRFEAAIFFSGGFYPFSNEPELLVAQAKHITMPVLMLNGRYDYLFPLDTHQKPLFDLLGTPANDKKHVVYEAGHGPFPRGEYIRETLDWLDRYLGPVSLSTN